MTRRLTAVGPSVLLWSVRTERTLPGELTFLGQSRWLVGAKGRCVLYLGLELGAIGKTGTGAAEDAAEFARARLGLQPGPKPTCEV
jgi:hypothetical protein